MKIGYYPKANKKNNVTYFLEQHANKDPHKVAFYYLSRGENHKSKPEYEQITFSQLYKNVTGFAESLSNLGIRKGSRVLVIAPISVDLYISIAGLQLIGAIPVLIDSLSRKDQLTHIIKNSKPVGVISLDRWFPMFEDLVQNFKVKLKIPSTQIVDRTDSAIVDNLFNKKPREIMPVNQNDTALVTYTTGSSGLPKGVNRTHRFLCAQHYALKRLFPYKVNTIDLPVFPVFTLNNLASCITTVIPEIDIGNPNSNDSEALVSQIKECGITCMTLAPSSFRNLAEYCINNDIELTKISRVLTGGAPISENDILNFNKITPNSKNWILYGSTEVEPIAYIESKDVLATKSTRVKNITEIGVNVGSIDTNLKHKFIDIEANDFSEPTNLNSLRVKNREVGELIVAGENVCEKYYKSKSAFKRTKIIDLKGTVWHRTGDLARLDKNNVLWIVGRKHNVIKYKNEFLFPVRPEILLKDFQFVTNSAYLEIKHKGVQKIVAVVSLTEYSDGMKKEISDDICNLFQKESLPLHEIIFVQNIPMDVRHHSKVDYTKLRQELNENYT